MKTAKAGFFAENIKKFPRYTMICTSKAVKRPCLKDLFSTETSMRFWLMRNTKELSNSPTLNLSFRNDGKAIIPDILLFEFGSLNVE